MMRARRAARAALRLAIDAPRYHLQSMFAFGGRAFNGIALILRHKLARNSWANPAHGRRGRARRHGRCMLNALRQSVCVEQGQARCRRRQGDACRRARQRLVRAVLPAQDRPQDHAARRRRGAGARAPSARAACCRPASSCPARARRTCWRSPSASSSPRCRDWEDCAANGVSMKFAVNVPVSALVKLPIADILREERPQSANWPGLILEVTEDEIIHDLKIANDVADALRASQLHARARRFRRRLFLARAPASSCRSASSRSTAPT